MLSQSSSNLSRSTEITSRSLCNVLSNWVGKRFLRSGVREQRTFLVVITARLMRQRVSRTVNTIPVISIQSLLGRRSRRAREGEKARVKWVRAFRNLVTDYPAFHAAYLAQVQGGFRVSNAVSQLREWSEGDPPKVHQEPPKFDAARGRQWR